MLPKPVRIALFIAAIFAFFGLSVGVTQAANKYLFAVGTGTRSSTLAQGAMQLGATEDPSATPDPSLTPDPSATPEADLEDVELSGVISAINGDVWTIGDVNVLVTADTEVDGSPAVGDTVKVEAVLQADGTYVAHEIESSSGMDENDDQDDDHSAVSTPKADDDHEEVGSGGQGEHDGGDDGEHEGHGSRDGSGGGEHEGGGHGGRDGGGDD